MTAPQIKAELTPKIKTETTPKTENLAENFEAAFWASHACATHPEGYLRTDHEETRATADQCMNTFLDAARQLEVFFLKKRLVLCRDKPENILREEIENVEAEIERKNQAVARHRERLKQWRQTLAEVGKAEGAVKAAAPTPPTPGTVSAAAVARRAITPTQTPPPSNMPAMNVPSMRGRGGGRGSRGGYNRSPGRATPTNPDSNAGGPLAHLEHATSQVGR